MIFSSIFFLLYFLPAFIILYSLTPKKYKNYTVLLLSLLFYSWGAPKFVFILLFSSLANFYIVNFLDKSTNLQTKKRLLVLSILLNLGLLAYYKYANFFIENTNQLLQFSNLETIELIHVVLPIGISFYTFQTITYSVDVYKKISTPLTKSSDYLLYIFSFPQMIAGPIVRFNTVSKEIIDRKDSSKDKLIGFVRFSIGLSKKVLIANSLGSFADQIMTSDFETLGLQNAWLGILAYTFQIYFDFAGYSDMAIGLGKIMGFNFPENFKNPYVATSITSFWKKWHITLGDWMRDYLYIPLGGNRSSAFGRKYINLAIVFLVSGLWHGASWNFILWGAFHGLFLILDRIFLMKILSKIGRPLAIIITFFIVMMSWVVFRIENINDALMYYNQLFLGNSTSLLLIDLQTLMGLFFAFIFSFITFFDFGKKLEDYFYNLDGKSNNALIYLFLIATILYLLSLSFLTSSDFNPFIYFRF